MPSNLTWWEARDYAVAGTPVRREPDNNPCHWITHTTGLFYLHEESNEAIPGYVVGDPTRHIVRNAEFGPDDFLASNWTTLEPGASEPVTPPGSPAPVPPPPPIDTPPGVPDPTPGGYPPTTPALPTPTAPSNGGGSPGGSGGSGGPAPTGSTNGGPIVVNPPVLPPGGDAPPPPPNHLRPVAPPVPLPVFDAFLADSGPPSVGCRLTGIGAGQGWGVTAFSPGDGITWNFGTISADATLSIAAPGLTGAKRVEFKAVSLVGPQTLRGNTLTGFVAASD